MKFNIIVCFLATACLFQPIDNVMAKNTLMDIYLDAVDNDPQIRAEYALYQAQISSEDKTYGNLLPSVILTGEIARNREDVQTGAGATGVSGLYDYNSNLLALTV